MPEILNYITMKVASCPIKKELAIAILLYFVFAVHMSSQLLISKNIYYSMYFIRLIATRYSRGNEHDN